MYTLSGGTIVNIHERRFKSTPVFYMFCNSYNYIVYGITPVKLYSNRYSRNLK